MQSQYWIAIWLLINLLAVGVWDIAATFNGNGRATVSSVIYEWVTRWPLLAAAMGGLLIHLIGMGPRSALPMKDVVTHLPPGP